MFDTKSDYALNKRGKSAIVCSSATGVRTSPARKRSSGGSPGLTKTQYRRLWLHYVQKSNPPALPV